MRIGLLDELTKIADIDLTGLSPQTVLERGQPAPPMETSAVAKAFSVLDRLGSMETKTAAPSTNQFTMPGFDALSARSSSGRKKGSKHPEVVVVDRAKSLGAHTLGGAAAGKLIGEALPATKAAREVVRKSGRIGVAAGAAVGASEFARKRLTEAHRAKQLHKAAMAMGLPQQSSKLTGKLTKMKGRATASPRSLERSAKGALGGF
jgi:hypothetical protein